MEAKINASLFRRLIESVSELINESVFDFTSEGLSLQSMDTAHIAVVEAKLAKEAFHSYRCVNSHSIGIGLTSLVKILRGISEKDILILSLKESNTTHLNLIINSLKHGSITEYDLQLMSIDREALEMKHLLFCTKVESLSKEMARNFRDLGHFGQTITIDVSEENILLSSDNLDIKARIHLKSGSVNHITCTENIHQTFCARYLNIIGRAASIANKLTLEMGPDVPLLIQYNLNNSGFLKFYLVSKVDPLTNDDT